MVCVPVLVLSYPLKPALYRVMTLLVPSLYCTVISPPSILSDSPTKYCVFVGSFDIVMPLTSTLMTLTSNVTVRLLYVTVRFCLPRVYLSYPLTIAVVRGTSLEVPFSYETVSFPPVTSSWSYLKYVSFVGGVSVIFEMAGSLNETKTVPLYSPQETVTSLQPMTVLSYSPRVRYSEGISVIEPSF